jgi:hypothetical protein
VASPIDSLSIAVWTGSLPLERVESIFSGFSLPSLGPRLVFVVCQESTRFFSKFSEVLSLPDDAAILDPQSLAKSTALIICNWDTRFTIHHPRCSGIPRLVVVKVAEICVADGGRSAAKLRPISPQKLLQATCQTTTSPPERLANRSRSFCLRVLGCTLLFVIKARMVAFKVDLNEWEEYDVLHRGSIFPGKARLFDR